MKTAKEIEEINNYRLFPNILGYDYLHLNKLVSVLRNRINKHLEGKKKLIILDIGCGTKPYYPLFKKYAKKYIGLDMVKEKTVDVIGSIDKIPFPDNSFDVCLCTQVLEHVPDPPKSIQEIYRVLKKDGLIFLSTHGIWEKHDSCDYWRFTDESLKMLFDKFSDIKIINNGNSILVAFQIINLTLSRIFKRPFSYFLKPIYLFNNILGKLLDRFGDQRLTINYLVVARK